MKVLTGPPTAWPTTAPSAVTIGVLDGLHTGHRALLRRLDGGLARTVLTFDPHPIEVLRPGTPARLITTLDERLGLLRDEGIGTVGVLDLGDIREQSPEEFVTEVLLAKLQARKLVVGEDFRFGRDRAGDVGLLARMGGEHGFEVDLIAIVQDEGEPVSSSRIRTLIQEGDVARAAVLLGSRFVVTNRVVDGEKRGRELGFPTANLRPPPRKLVPANGVYACFASWDAHTFPAAVNVGVRPTFGGEELLIEAYVLDFDGDLYGRELTVEFVEHLRPELAFDGADALVEQMREDVLRAREILVKAKSEI